MFMKIVSSYNFFGNMILDNSILYLYLTLKKWKKKKKNRFSLAIIIFMYNDCSRRNIVNKKMQNNIPIKLFWDYLF